MAVQICIVSYVENFVSYIWWSASLKKATILNTVASLTVNSVMDIFLQVLQNFQSTMIKPEHILKLDNYGGPMLPTLI